MGFTDNEFLFHTPDTGMFAAVDVIKAGVIKMAADIAAVFEYIFIALIGTEEGAIEFSEEFFNIFLGVWGLSFTFHR